MSNLVMTNGAAGALLYRPGQIAVDLEDGVDPPLALIAAMAEDGSAGATATFEWTATPADFGQARQIVQRGRRIRARLARTTFPGQIDDCPIFDGFVVTVRVEFDGHGRRVLVDAIDGVRFLFGGTSLLGTHSLDACGRVVARPDEPLVFNACGRPNRSLSQVAVSAGGQRCHVFDFTSRAAFWSAADIADYLIASRLLDTRIDWPGQDSLQSLSGGVRPHGLDLTGESPLVALERLAAMSGCGLAIEPISSVRRGGRWRVAWFGPSGRRSIALHHQPAGEPVTTLTNVASGQLQFDHDSVRRVSVGIGEPERVESTFALVRGWDDSLAGGSHRAYSRANPRFAQVRDVYRRWVLNEAGDWSAAPFGRGPAAGLADLFGLDSSVLRRRRFRPTLSLDANGKSFGVLVEVSYDSGTTWGNYPGRIEVLADEAGVWFADDSLPPDYWQAATAGLLAVRATATIDSDRRVQAEVEDCPRADARRTIRRIVRLPGRFRRQWVAQSSRLAGGPADAVDDRDALAAVLAEHVRRDRRAGTRGRLSLPWLTAVWQVGDRIAGIFGQGLSFDGGRRDGHDQPLVRGVRHELGENWQTTLELE